MKRIAHHRHALPSRTRSPVPRDILHDDIWHGGTGITFMPIMVRISTLHPGSDEYPPQYMTASDLRETLILALDADEARIDFVCRQVEETGSCELGDDSGQSGYRFDKVLHA
ncbi:MULTISPECIES: hypothetical protein [unclassified Rhizobium]|uniref:hypothetical protein n=1 Tax=unclassified Rhizobium TaxID=2613769 RepID=UPI000AAD7010|nr:MULTISPECIES: hypothetical protein [unclassified Rhizobium]